MQTQGRKQQGTASQTLLDVFESDSLAKQLAKLEYKRYPVPDKKSINQRPKHPGDNYLAGEATAIIAAREKAKDEKNEIKNKKGRRNTNNSISYTSDLASKGRLSKTSLQKKEQQQLTSEENKNKTNKAKKKDDEFYFF